MIGKLFTGKGGDENGPPAKYDDLSALFINCTLKKSPAPSHTDLLLDVSRAIMEKNGVAVESVRFVDHDIAVGVYPDMTEHGWAKDDWPAVWKKLEQA
ncbi:MAG: hypothetical protein ACX939_00235, partial [Hyphococcus sp.]